MQETVNSIQFLWAAYVVVFVANIGLAGWFASKWSRLNKPKR